MSRIGPIRDQAERVTVDGDYRPAFHFTDRDGNDEDLTASGVDAWCEIKKADGTGSTITRKISNGTTEYAYITDGTDGKVEFIYLTAAIAALDGAHNVDVWYVKAASSVKRKVHERVVYFDAERT